MRNRERDTGQGQRLNPAPAPSGPLRPQASLRPSVRRRAPGLQTRVSACSPTPGRPCLSASPSSAPRRRSRHHVTLAPLFPRGRFAKTRLSLGARPFASREPASPRSAPSPAFLSRWWQPPAHLRETPLYSVLPVFRPMPGVLPSAPEASLSAPLHGASHPVRVPGRLRGASGRCGRMHG